MSDYHIPIAVLAIAAAGGAIYLMRSEHLSMLPECASESCDTVVREDGDKCESCLQAEAEAREDR